MPALTGYLDSNGHPILSIRVAGPSGDMTLSVEAMIETGFSGFLMLPIAETRGLELVARGTSDFGLANGTVVTYRLAKGSVTVLSSVESTPVEGRIVLGGDEAPLGMDFIRKLNKWLVVGKAVLLVDDWAIESTLLASN